MLLEAAAAEEEREAAGGGGGGGGRRRALPYAVALAAVLSVDSPFVHVDSIAAAEGGEAEGEQGRGQGGEEAGAAAQQKEAAKKRRAAARQAHAAFRVVDSDALSALRALCAFEAAGEGEAFCRRSFLHFKNLREAAALHRQLARALEAQAGAAPGNGAAAPPRLSAAALAPAGGLPPPPPGVAEALRRALAAGWADQVARRVRSLDHIRAQGGQGSRSRAVRYRPAAPLDEDVFLHPASALHSAAPELAVYTELVRTAKRPYMAGLTAVEPRWLAEVAAPLCAFSPPLADPPPFYAPARDEVRPAGRQPPAAALHSAA
jgi:ATP-dependent RNA helicase DHX37/DHR1